MAALKNYKRGMDWLNKNFPFFTVIVTNLGRPVVNNEIPTLQVQRNRDDKQFELVINEKFLEPLSDEEVAATLTHEAFHIVLSHLNEIFSLDDSDETTRKKMTLAQECIVNDNVVNEGFSLPDLRTLNPETGQLEGGLFFGPDVVGLSVAYYTTKEVMDLIPDDNKQLQSMDGNGENDHYVIMSDDDLKDLQDILSKGVRHAVYEGKIDPNDITSEDLKNIMKINSRGKKAGTSVSKTQRNFTKMGLSVNWFKYLRRLDPSAFREGGSMGDLRTSWHAPRKKTAYMYPKVSLPVYRPRFTKNNIGSLKPHIVLALDFSGSIPPAMTTVMGNLARAVPDGIEIHCCTFSTYHIPFNHKTDDYQDTASGGTDFSAIEEFIETLELKCRPNVVVITDGEAGFNTKRPSQDDLDKHWNWLLINKGNQVQAGNIKNSTVEFLEDYLLQK